MLGRFIHPVRVGSVMRSTAKVDSVTDVEGGVQMVVAHTVTIEVDGDQRLGLRRPKTCPASTSQPHAP